MRVRAQMSADAHGARAGKWVGLTRRCVCMCVCVCVCVCFTRQCDYTCTRDGETLSARLNFQVTGRSVCVRVSRCTLWASTTVP